MLPKDTSQSLEPVDVSLYGKNFKKKGLCICNYIKGLDEEMILNYPGGLKCNHMLSQQEEGRGRFEHTEKRRQHEDGAERFRDAGAEVWSDELQAEDSWQPPDTGEDQEQIPPYAPGGGVALPTPWFQPSKTDFELLGSRTVR